MAKSRKNPKVDAFFNQAAQWREEMARLREIILDCGLSEELKWSKPCYSFQDGNVVIIQGFKDYCALLFFKGVLMKDTHGLLVKTGENTRVGRQIRFTDVRGIVKHQAALKDYIRQAIEVEKTGLKVDLPENTGPAVPEELQKILAKNRALKTAFGALTPGRQRAYIYYFAAAKQSATRVSRIEKCAPRILKGRGLLDP